jgi:hypothetical protein
VGFWLTKWHGRFSPSIVVSPASFLSTNCFTITVIYNLGLVQQANSGRCTKWTHKGMVRSDMSKPALIFFSTARVHTTKSTVKVLAANSHRKYFLKIAEHCQYCNLPDPWRNVHPYQSTLHSAVTSRLCLNARQGCTNLWYKRFRVQKK